MNPGLVVKLRPAGPWRIGPNSGARNRVDAIYHSDSLYSAVTLAMSRLGRLDEWLDATARSATPAVCFSSCFPFLDDIGFVVPPRTMWPPTSPALMSARVRWKSARFVPLGIVQALAHGQTLVENHWSVDGPSECLVPAGKPGPFRTGVRWGAAVDRLSGASERHSTACLEFRPGAGLWTIVSFADEAAHAQWSDAVKTAFRLLADTGFGGERSRGWGRAEAPEFIEGVLPDMILGAGPSMGTPLPSPVPPLPPGTPLPMAAPAGTPLPLPVGTPLPAGTPLPMEAPAGTPLPLPVGTPLPAGTPLPMEAPAGTPLPLPVGTPLPAGTPLPLESAAVEAPPATEPLIAELVSGTPLPMAEAAPAAAPAMAMGAMGTPLPAMTAAQPEPGFGTPLPVVPGANRPRWLLSLFTPGPADAVDWARGNYTVVPRGGRIESPAAYGELKKQVQMVAEGSVVFAAAEPHGAAADVAPDGFPHPVYRAGFALSIPLPEVG